MLGFSIICGFQIRTLGFNYDFEAFFPNEDNELELYNSFRKTFEYDNEFVLISLENKAGIFKKDFLTKVDSLTKELGRLQYIKKATSPTNLKHLSLGGIVPMQSTVLHWNDPALYKDDSTAIYRSGEMVGSFFPANARSLCIFLKTDDELSKVKSDTLCDRILGLINKQRFDEIHFVGRIFGQRVYLEKIKSEFIYFLVISLSY